MPWPFHRGGASCIFSRAVLHLDASAMSKRANETPHGERSETRGVEAGASEREIRIAELRLGLKLKAGPLPSITSVAVALELATGNDQTIQNLLSGGAARKRARKLCDRIVAEGLLQDSHFRHRRKTASIRSTVEDSLSDPYPTFSVLHSTRASTIAPLGAPTHLAPPPPSLPPATATPAAQLRCL